MTGRDLTAPVRAKDRQIECLADIVRDLVAIGPEKNPSYPHNLFCRWCLGVGHANGTRIVMSHEVDCPLPRAELALKGL